MTTVNYRERRGDMPHDTRVCIKGGAGWSCAGTGCPIHVPKAATVDLCRWGHDAGRFPDGTCRACHRASNRESARRTRYQRRVLEEIA